MAKNRVPGYCRQRRSTGDLAYVEFPNGMGRSYLGVYDSPESRLKYNQLIAEWQTTGGFLFSPGKDLTITELCARFLAHAEGYYCYPDGTPTSEIVVYKNIISLLREMYGNVPVKDFGSLKMKAFRDQMIVIKWVRTNINRMVNRTRHIFKWGVSEELVSASVLHGLQAVEGLKRGRCKADESGPVHPVPDADIEAIRPFVSRQVWTLVQLQLHTAARPGELVGLRAIDLDTKGNIWIFRSEKHKNSYRGQERSLYFGPRAQELLQPFMANRPLDAYLFSPCEAQRERWDNCPNHRHTEISKPKTPRKVGDVYDVAAYRRAIRRACENADLTIWHPHQLRHNAASFLRREYGVEIARAVLGHASLDATEIYAELDQQKVIEVIARIG